MSFQKQAHLLSNPFPWPDLAHPSPLPRRSKPSLFPSLPPPMGSMTNITYLQSVLLIPPTVTLNLNSTHLLALKMYFAETSLKAKYSHPFGASPRCFSSGPVSSQMTALLLAFLKNVQDFLRAWRTTRACGQLPVGVTACRLNCCLLCKRWARCLRKQEAPVDVWLNSWKRSAPSEVALHISAASPMSILWGCAVFYRQGETCEQQDCWETQMQPWEQWRP